MKNFYELLAIKKDIVISITVCPVIDILPPSMKLLINNVVLHNDILDQKKIIQHSMDLLDKLDIKIELCGKDYKKFRNMAIVIESCSIDCFEIVPKWTQVASYRNDQYMTQPTNYLGFNGVWNFKIDEPFYRWKHKITGQGWLLEP